MEEITLFKTFLESIKKNNPELIASMLEAVDLLMESTQVTDSYVDDTAESLATMFTSLKEQYGEDKARQILYKKIQDASSGWSDEAKNKLKEYVSASITSKTADQEDVEYRVAQTEKPDRRKWKSAISLGNRATAKKDYATALEEYKKAFYARTNLREGIYAAGGAAQSAINAKNKKDAMKYINAMLELQPKNKWARKTKEMLDSGKLLSTEERLGKGKVNVSEEDITIG